MNVRRSPAASTFAIAPNAPASRSTCSSPSVAGLTVETDSTRTTSPASVRAVPSGASATTSTSSPDRRRLAAPCRAEGASCRARARGSPMPAASRAPAAKRRGVRCQTTVARMKPRTLNSRPSRAIAAIGSGSGREHAARQRQPDRRAEADQHRGESERDDARDAKRHELAHGVGALPGRRPQSLIRRVATSMLAHRPSAPETPGMLRTVTSTFDAFGVPHPSPRSRIMRGNLIATISAASPVSLATA